MVFLVEPSRKVEVEIQKVSFVSSLALHFVVLSNAHSIE